MSVSPVPNPRRYLRWVLLMIIATVVAVAVGVGTMLSTTHGLDRMKSLVRSRFPEVVQLSTTELSEWMSDKTRTQPLLLDVREEEEFKVSHLPGARHVNPRSNPEDLRHLIPTNGWCVVYCSVGYRSSEFATRMIDKGFTNVMNLEGSIFQWANEDRPLQRQGVSVRQVHPYNVTFGRLLKPPYRPTKTYEADSNGTNP